MVRTASVDENGLKKGLWSQEEDDKLRAYMTRLPHFRCNWRKVPKFAGLSRCGKSCRLRWMNYLRPDVKRGNFSKEEDDLIVQLHQQLGNKWSRIAMELPGRTDNEIKNHWHTNLKKQTKKTHNQLLITTSKTQNQRTEISTTSPTKQSLQPRTDDVPSPFLPIILESSHISDSSSTAENNSVVTYEDSATDFWTQPFLTDDCYAYTQHDYISSYGSYYGDTADLIDQVLYQNNLEEYN